MAHSSWDTLYTGRFIMYSGITKIQCKKTVGHVFTKPVQTEGTTQNFKRCTCKHSVLQVTTNALLLYQRYGQVISVSVPAPLVFSTVACHVVRNIVCLLSSYMFRPELGHLHDLKLKKKALWDTIYRAFQNELRDYKNLLQENRRTRIYETCTVRTSCAKFGLHIGE